MHKNFSKVDVAAKKIIYTKPLIKATIINRPNRYVAFVKLTDGSIVRCHTPVGGRIGGMTIDNLPCLLSGPHEGRATDYTVEAIGLGQESDPEFQWLGINQTAANSYIKEFLLAGLLPDFMEGLNAQTASTLVKAEKKLGAARIDFYIESPDVANPDLWIEVKTPLIKLHTKLPAEIPLKTDYGTDNVGARMPKQMGELIKELNAGRRVILLAAFGYENTLKTSDELRMKDNLDLDSLLTTGRKVGLESWQLTFEIDAQGVTLKGYEKLT